MPTDATVDGHRAGLHRGLEAGPEGRRHLPRRLQAHPAAQRRQGEGEGGRRRPPARRRWRGGGCRTSGAPSPTSSPSPATRATSPSACTRTACPARSSWSMAKEGSTVSGLMDTFATSISIALQYGVPLQVLVDKFSHTRFEPSGFTGNPEIPIAKSITDYIFRWMALKFLPSESGRHRPRRRPRCSPGTAPAASARARTVDATPAPRPAPPAPGSSAPTPARPTPRRARAAARSPCATAPATSATTAGPRRAALKRDEAGFWWPRRRP